MSAKQFEATGTLEAIERRNSRRQMPTGGASMPVVMGIAQPGMGRRSG